MKNHLLFALLILFLIGCSDQEKNLNISGKIKGLKEGTIYLQKMQDTALVTIDSVVIQGNPNFDFETYIENPQMLYLTLDKIDNEVFEDRMSFFAEKGEMNINTTLKNFGVDVEISGSENQKKLEEYQEIRRRFSEENLELTKQKIEAQQEGKDSLLAALQKQSENLIKRKYLYTINFAVTNKDKELAPYLALSEVYDANIQYLDTIYKSLTPQVQKSIYGKELKDFIEKRKELEQE